MRNQHNSRNRPLRRPLGGWGARQWRRDTLAGLLAAFWLLACAASVGLLLRLLDIAANGISSI